MFRTLALLVFPASALAVCPPGYVPAGGGCAHTTATVDPAAVIGTGATIQAGAIVGAATILDNAVIGVKASIGEGASVGGVVGRRAVVGAGATIPDGSVLARAVTIGDDTTALGPITVGYGAQVGPGATLGSATTTTTIGNLANVAGGVTVGGGARIGRAASIGADAIVGDNVVVGPGCRMAASSQAQTGARLRRGSRLAWGATAGSDTRIGRDVRVGRSATVEASARVQAGAVIGSGTRVVSGGLVSRGATLTATTDGALLQDIILLSGRSIDTTSTPWTFRVYTGSVELAAQAVDRDGDPPQVTWTVLGTLPAGWSLSGQTTTNLTVNAPSAGTALFELSTQDATGNGTTQTVRVTTVDVPPWTRLVDSGGGIREWADGTHATSCRDYHDPPAGYVYAGATGDGSYRIDPDGPNNGQSPFVAECLMTQHGGGWTRYLSLTDAASFKAITAIPKTQVFVDNGTWQFHLQMLEDSDKQLLITETVPPYRTHRYDFTRDPATTGNDFAGAITGDLDVKANVWNWATGSWEAMGPPTANLPNSVNGRCNTNNHSQWNCEPESGPRFHYSTRDWMGDGGISTNDGDWWFTGYSTFTNGACCNHESAYLTYVLNWDGNYNTTAHDFWVR